MAGKDTDPMIDDFGFERFDPTDLSIDDRKMTPVQKALRGAQTGFKETALTKATLEKLVRSALPSGVRRTYDEISDVASTGKDLYNSLNEQLSPQITRLKRNVRKVMPSVRDKLPNPLAKAIDNLLKDKTPATSSYEEYDPDTETIKGAMRDVFEAQRMVDEHQRTEDEAKRVLNDRVNKQRNDVQVRQLDAVRQGILRVANYQDTVAVRRDQKLLELQYRQYFTQRDLLAEQRKSNQLVIAELNAVVKNTALPDIAKVRAYEKQMENLGLADRARNRVDAYKDKFRDAVKQRATRHIRRFATAAQLGLSGANLALGSMGGGGRFGPSIEEQLGEGLGGEAASGLAGYLGQRLGRQLRKIPGVARTNARLDYYANNAPELLNEWAKKRSRGVRLDFWNDDATSLGRRYGARGINFLKSLIPRHTAGAPEFSAQGYGGNREVVSYDELSRKSIVEIIPGLLQRILQSVDGIRTGNPAADKTIYDHSVGQFVTGKEMRESVSKQLLPKGASESLKRNVDLLARQILGRAPVSNAAREGLKRQLLHDMAKGKRFNPESYSKSRMLDQISDPKVAVELAGVIRKRFLGADGKLKGSTRAYDRLNNISVSYQSARSNMPNFTKGIEQLLDSGNRDILHELGVLKRDGKRDFLDPSFIADAVFGLGGDDGENPSPHAGGQDGEKANRRGGRRNRRRNRVRGGGGSSSTAGMDQGPSPRGNSEDLTDLADRLKRAAEGDPELASRLNEAFRGEPSVEDESARGSLDDVVDDVYVRGERFPRLTRAGILARRYICKTTNRVVESLADIQGPIVDATGRVLLDAGDAMKGLATASGRRLGEISDAAKGWVERAGHLRDIVMGRVTNVTDQFKQGMFGLRGLIDDVYVIGQPEPVLTATKMRAGHYVNRWSKKPIKTIDDVRGSVIDIEGNVVLTEEDYEKGLRLKDGTLIRRSGFLYQAGRFTNWYFGGYYRNLWKLMKKGATLSKKVATGLAKKLLGPVDVYVPGEESPRLLATMLRRGMYVSSKTGRRIYRVSQIDSDVLGPDGDVVLTEEELRAGVVDKFGKPIRVVLARLTRKLMGAATAPLRWAKNYWNRSMRIGGGLAQRGLEKAGSLLGWGFDKLTGFRSGSWEERRAKKAEEKKRKREEKAEKKKEKKQHPLAALLLTMATGLKLGLGKVLDKLNPLRYLKDIRTLLRGGDLLGDLLGGGRRRRGRGRGRPGLLRRAGRGIATAGRYVGSGLATGGRALLATAAGSALASGASAAMTGIASAATAIGGGIMAVITSPVTLTAAAVAAAGFGAWWLWKKFGASPDPIQQVRLSMYGVEMGDRDTNAKVLKLEESMADYSKAYAGKASFTGNLPMKDIYEMFDINTEAEQYKLAFDQWFARRFRPVFLKFLAKGHEILPDVKVHEQDDKIPDGDKPRLVRECRYSSESAMYPYNIPFGPNPPQRAMVGTKEIDKAIAEVESKFAKAEREKRAKDIAKQRRAENSTIPTGNANELAEATKKLNAPEMRYTTDSKLDKVRTNAINAKADVSMELFKAGADRRIDELAGIRLRTYGLVELDKDRVDTLMVMESDLLARVYYDSDGQAGIDYDAAEDFETYAPRFAVSITDWKQRWVWMDWYRYRFIPTVLAFATAVRAINKTLDPKEAYLKLKPEDQVKIATTILSAQSRPFILKVSVWTVDDSPWPGYEMNVDSASTNDAMESLKAKTKTQKLQEERTTQANPNSGTGISALADKETREAAQNMHNSTLGVLRALGYGNNSSTVGAVAPYPPGSAAAGQMGTVDGGGSSGGAGYGTTFGQGTGGSYDMLPNSKGDGWENNKDLILKAAEMTGADPRAMAIFAGMESGWKPGIKAADNSSTATGLYQFIEGTWREQLKAHGAKYGIGMDAVRTDPKANALIGGEFMKWNNDMLAKKLGRAPTMLDIYLSHFFGPAGVSKWFKIPADGIAAQAMPTEAAANKWTFYADNGKGRALTRAEIESGIIKRINAQAKLAGMEGAGSAPMTFGAGTGGAPATPATTPAAQPEGTVATTPQNVPAASIDNRAPLSESVLPGETVAMNENVATNPPPVLDPSSPGGYMGNAPQVSGSSSVAAAQPTQSTAPTQTAQRPAEIPSVNSSSRAVKAQPPVVEQVSRADLQDVLGKQLEAQVQSRDLIAKIYALLSERQSTSTGPMANDKSAEISRRTTAASSATGSVSMTRGISG